MPPKKSTTGTPSKQAFDASYYTRFYEDPATRAVSEEEQRRQADFIAAYLRYLDIGVHSILDVGCGIGTLLHAVSTCIANRDKRSNRRAQKTRVVTHGIEISEYLCTKYGWTQASILDYEGDGADLVICNDVLGYLNKKDARKALRKLANLSHQALYFSVITLDDLDICDQEHTDMSQKLRPATWYQTELARYFMNVGGGLYLKQPVSVPVWRLERA